MRVERISSRRADQWRFGSLWYHEHGSSFHRALLTDWPVPRPDDWSGQVDQALTPPELAAIRRCSRKELPYGDDEFVAESIERFGLNSRTRGPGRPRKKA